MVAPTRERGTVRILSTMIWERSRSPLAASGSSVMRKAGALTGALLTPSLLGAIAAQWGVGKVMLLPALGAMMVAVLVLLIWLEARLTKS